MLEGGYKRVGRGRKCTSCKYVLSGVPIETSKAGAVASTKSSREAGSRLHENSGFLCVPGGHRQYIERQAFGIDTSFMRDQ